MIIIIIKNIIIDIEYYDVCYWNEISKCINLYAKDIILI
jgi:hypothetical protein